MYLAAEKPVLGVMRGEVARLVISHNLGAVGETNDVSAIRDAILRLSGF